MNKYIEYIAKACIAVGIVYWCFSIASYFTV